MLLQYQISIFLIVQFSIFKFNTTNAEETEGCQTAYYGYGLGYAVYFLFYHMSIFYEDFASRNFVWILGATQKCKWCKWLSLSTTARAQWMAVILTDSPSPVSGLNRKHGSKFSLFSNRWHLHFLCMGLPARRGATNLSHLLNLNLPSLGRSLRVWNVLMAPECAPDPTPIPTPNSSCIFTAPTPCHPTCRWATLSWKLYQSALHSPSFRLLKVARWKRVGGRNWSE